MRRLLVSTDAYIGEGLLAAFLVADMRLFARVGSRVDGQGTALDETLVTALYVAIIGPLVGVDAIMAAEIRLAIKRLFPGTYPPSVSTHEPWGIARICFLPCHNAPTSS